jgi:NAD(P)-dependent dehydrogenase (short-subunit alcohol dehydrogenase family)
MSRTVVVTSGAKGIGRAVVQGFAALGDDVVTLGRDEHALARLQVRTAVCDVTDEDAVAATFKHIGTVDVLVNNAGIAESAPLARTTLESWLRHFDVNVTGPFLCMRAVVPGMRERGSGSVVTVPSTAGPSALHTRAPTRPPSTPPLG